MTVRQLMNRLAKLDPKAEVVLSHYPFVFDVNKCKPETFCEMITTLPYKLKDDLLLRSYGIEYTGNADEFVLISSR